MYSPHKFMWKIKIPAKIKVFLWLMGKGAFLLKITSLEGDGLVTKCVFIVGKMKAIDHLFFQCSTTSTHNNLTECFGSWIKSFPKLDKKNPVPVGISAIL